MELWEAVAKRIIFLCAQRKITLNKLATLAGITQSTLDNIVKGNSKNPKLKTLVLISSAFCMRITDFLDDENILNADID